MSSPKQAELEADPLLKAKTLAARAINSRRWDDEMIADVLGAEQRERHKAKSSKAQTRLSEMVDQWGQKNKPALKTIDRMSAVVSWFEDMVAKRYGASLINFPLRPLVNAIAEYRVTGLTLPEPPPAYRKPG